MTNFVPAATALSFQPGESHLAMSVKRYCVCSKNNTQVTLPLSVFYSPTNNNIEKALLDLCVGGVLVAIKKSVKRLTHNDILLLN